MAGEVRSILDCLDGQMLRKLCELRGLPVSGSVDDKRSRLARSFRGHVDELLPHLHRNEMIAALEIFTFAIEDGREGHWVGLANAAWDELRRAMERIFIDDWEPAPGRLQPLGPSSSIRIAWDEAEDDDDDEDDDGFVDDEDAQDETDYERASLASTSGSATSRRGQEVGEFYEWLAEHLSTRGASTLLIKTLVNRLGNYRADERLRTRAVQDLASVLAMGGFAMDPDLTRIETSPGIDARVRVSRRSSMPPQRSLDWQPVPTLAQPIDGGSAAPSPNTPPSTPSLSSEFERAAAKLKFLTTVAASIERPDDDVRRRAVELASQNLGLSTADKLRLRALAHQYAAGHEDLRVTVRQLRVALPETERRSLLIHLRSLAPATTELEELIQTYATDLSISTELAISIAPTLAPAAAANPEVFGQRAEGGAVRNNAVLDQVFEPQPEQPKAGGARENAALDDIFSRGDDS
jgi:hypothetical protein